MSKNISIRATLYLLLIIVCLYHGKAQAQPDNKQRKVGVGKENPFIKLPEKNKEVLTLRKTSSVSGTEETPQLFVEVVSLKHLNADSLRTVIENLSSEYGQISVDEKTNSLIICDTKEYLERILAQIHDADETTIPQQDTISELVAESINLEFLNAKDLKTAIENMCSERGSISIIEKSNSLIVCDTRKNLEMIIAEIKKIDKPTPGLLVETVTLKFLEAENLKKAIDSMSSQYGSIATDDGTNSLIICDTKDKLEEILAEIRKADRTPRQIMIEVVIVDVQLNDETEIGVDWTDILSLDADLGDQFPTGSHSRSFMQDIIPSTLAGSSLRIIQGSVGVTIEALQQVRNVEILASPRVLVVSGEEAYIKTVEEIAYEESSDTSAGGSLTSTAFKEAGITLTVKAILTDENQIMLTLEPDQSVNTGVNMVSGSSVPVVDRRAAKTTLLLRDGQIAVMGGLRKKETRISEDKIPLLGDLPIVGFLFSDKKTEVKYSELLVFVAPHIYDDGPIPADQMKKFNELKDRPMLSLPKDKDNEIKNLLSTLSFEK